MANGIKNPDYPSIVGRADLRYDGTVDMSDEGIPIGNGTMGSLIWTSPWSVKLQINRVDVYASSAASESFNIRNNDYSLGCALVDIDFGYTAVFPKSGTKQHLSVYDGMISIEGEGVSLRIVSSQSSDLFAFEIDDRRTVPEPVTVKLRMLRPSEVYEKNHSAVSVCIPADESISLKQEFQEADHFCSSAVSAIATGGTIATRFLNETGKAGYRQSSEKVPGIGISMESEIELSIRPDGANAGKRKVYLSSAASFDPEGDTVAASLDTAKSAMREGFAGVAEKARKWWNDFWAGEYIRLSSEDGKAEHVEYHYHYHLYLMACCGRGSFAPRYGCMLFSTYGDKRAWGAQQWWTNVSLYYRGLYPTGKLELFNGFYNHYTAVRDSCSLAAEQQWGAEGIYYPETMWFDGLAPLPEDIAEEMRDLYLCRRPWVSRSKRFEEYSSVRHPHSSRWNWIGHGKWVHGTWTYGYNAVPPFSPVNHFFASGAEIAFLFWKRYEYTRDIEWLRDIGYPVIKGVARFLSTFPNFVLEDDGMYHVHNVNQGEHLRGARDTFDYLCAVKGVLPAAEKAAEVLGVDDDLRAEWIDIAAKSAPLPTSADEDSVEKGSPDEPVRFTDARTPVVDGKPRPAIEEFNARFYDFDMGTLSNSETGDNLFELADNSFAFRYPDGVREETPVRVMSSLPVIAAKLGRSNDFKNAVCSLIDVVDPARDYCDFEGQRKRGALPNRMTNREGVNAIGAQRLGTTVYAVNEALCQSDPPEPGGLPVVRLFPAWPKEWDADFRLKVRGGFAVASSIKGGKIDTVQITAVEPNADRVCRLRNPWSGSQVQVTNSDGSTDTFAGDLVEVPMSPGGMIEIQPV